MPKSPESVIKRLPEQDDWAIESREQERVNPFVIWYLEPSISILPGNPKWDESRDLIDSWIKDREMLDKLQADRREKRLQSYKEGKTMLERPFLTKPMSPTDLRGEIKCAYAYDRSLESTPDLIIAREEPERDEITGGGLGNQIAGLIRKDIREILEDKGLEHEENRLQPIIALVGKVKRYNELWIKEGGNLLLPEYDIEDIDRLAQLVAKLKSDPASIMPEEVINEKRAFYDKVEGMAMEDRSKITADTKQELEILNDLLPQDPLPYKTDTERGVSWVRHEDINVKRHNEMRILDVGCGSGRITNRLAQEHEDYTIFGLEGNTDLIATAEEEKPGNTEYIEGDLIDYSKNEAIIHASMDAVIYTWHSFLEAFGPGNTIRTLNSAWLALKEGGTLIFDQPTRKNKDLSDGWYYSKVDEETEYLSYIMTEDEIRFILKITGFKDVEFTHWKTQSSELYPEGMDKITVKAKKVISSI